MSAGTNKSPSMNPDHLAFQKAVPGLVRGDFSRLEPLFVEDPSGHQHECRIVEWYKKRYFETEPKALAETLSCACFLGRTRVVEFLLTQGVDLTRGDGTGLNGFHWAANRGKLETVKLLIERKAPLEIKSMYGGTVLGTAVWSAVNEPRADHVPIIEALIIAGANVDAAGYPSGNVHVDEVLRRHGAS
jgi:Ankyrin repeats (3 copies)